MNKPRLLLASATAAALTAAPLSQIHAQGAAPLIKDGLSPHFMAVASKLELGGAGFSYAEEAETLALISDFIDEAMKSMPAEERAKMPADFSFRKLLTVLGLDKVKASGTSTRKLPDGRYHSRTFAYMPEGRKGLLTLAGGPAEPFLLHELAPTGTDLAFEFPLYLKDFAKEALDTTSSVLSKKEKAEFDKTFDQPQPPLGMSPRQMLEKLAARIGVFVRLNPDQKIPGGDSGITFPGADAAIVIEDLDWLLNPAKEGYMPMLASPQMPVNVSDKEGVFSVTFKSPMGPAPMDFQPCLWYSASKARLIVATRPAFLQAVLNPADKLAKEPAFAKAWQGLPEAGNGCLYASPRLLGTAVDSMKQGMNRPEVDAKGREVMEPIIAGISRYLNQPQVFCYANLPDGSYGAANSILPASGGGMSTLATISTISILSSLAVPSFNAIQIKANETTLSNNGRQVGLSLKIYANDNNGKYPANLSKLEGKELDNPDLLMVKDPSTEESAPWLYDASLTDSSPGSAIVLAAPFTSKKGSKETRVVVRNDGSTEAIPEAQFQKQKGQGLK